MLAEFVSSSSYQTQFSVEGSGPQKTCITRDYVCLSPVLLLIFRRPALTARVLETLRQVRPARLWVAADGARDDQAEEQRLCEQTRAIIETGIDWPCELRTRFLSAHAGCKKAVAEALDWAFAVEERLIILEDDCLPSADFFQFCDELLEKYESDERVMQISGTQCHGWELSGASFFFSRFGPIWGWASWRRAWQVYDVTMASWPELSKSQRIRELCPEPFEANWRRRVFEQVASGQLDTWDYQWAYAKLLAGGLNVVPNQNLISNLGFGDDATHTHDVKDSRAELPFGSMRFPLRAPAEVSACAAADRHYLQTVVGLPANRFSWRAIAWWLRQRLRFF